MEARLREALTDTPAVCLLGPRQCGKSTLAANVDPDRFYVSLDDAVYLKLALEDPQGFLAELPDNVTIDEVQRAPALSLAIKRSVDHDRRPGRYLLTGSANLLQLPQLAEYAKRDFQGGIVLYEGNDILPLGDANIFAVPISKLWEM